MCLILAIYSFYFVLGIEINRHQIQDDDMGNDTDFLLDVTRIQKSKELRFGHGSGAHGRDSRYWDKDDRRRDDDYSEEDLEQAHNSTVDKIRTPLKTRDKLSYNGRSNDGLIRRGNGLYNEAGRNELKMYEAKYEASLKNTEESTDLHDNRKQQSQDLNGRDRRELDDLDEYDDGVDLQDDPMEEGDDAAHDDMDHSSDSNPHLIGNEEASLVHHIRNKKQHNDEEADEVSADLNSRESLTGSHDKVNKISDRASSAGGRLVRRMTPEKRPSSKKKSRRRKFSGNHLIYLVIWITFF